MNNSLRYLVVVSLALGFTTSVVCAEAAVQVAQEVSKVEVEASVVALMTTKTEAPEVKVEAPVAPVTTKTEAPEVKVEAPVAPVTTNSFISRSFATVSGAATGSLTALSGVIVAHPVIAAAGLTVTTVLAVNPAAAITGCATITPERAVNEPVAAPLTVAKLREINEFVVTGATGASTLTSGASVFVVTGATGASTLTSGASTFVVTGATGASTLTSG